MHDLDKAKKTIVENIVKLPFADLCLIQSQLSEHIFNCVQNSLIQQQIKKEGDTGPDPVTVLN